MAVTLVIVGKAVRNDFPNVGGRGVGFCFRESKRFFEINRSHHNPLLDKGSPNAAAQGTQDASIL